MVAPISLEAGLPAGIAPMMILLLENVGLRATPATVVAGTMPTTPVNSIAEVAELPAFSAAVMF